MRKSLSLVSMIALAAGPLAAAETPTAEAVLDQFIAATGGKAAYERIRTEMTLGSFEFPGKGIRGTAASYKAAPNKSYIAMEIPGVGKIEDGSNGEIAWNRSALQGPRLKEGDEKAAALREATFNAPVYWRKLYKKVELSGKESVGDQACYKVILTPNEGKPETHYYDAKSHYLVKVTMTVTTPMGEITADTLVGDYRDIDGIMTPHRMEQSAMGQQLLITFDSVKWNKEIPKERFEVPADVRALLPK